MKMMASIIGKATLDLSSLLRRLALAAALTGAVIVTGAAHASPDAHVVIANFQANLLDVMKNSQSLGYAGRYKRLDAALSKAFDLNAMAKVAVGRQWSSLTPDQQTQLDQLFRQLSAATFASRFDGYTEGEHFEIVDSATLPDGDLTVRTRLVLPKQDAVGITYRMHNGNAGWQVIDVYLNDMISELAMRRSEFSSLLRQGGPDTLIRTIRVKVSELGSGV
jgi:phospholipid transport system substrate-binding protein